MKIEQPQILEAGEWTRLKATVTSGRNELDVYYEVPSEFGDWLAPSVDAFLPSISVLAPFMRESRLDVVGASPQLVDGTETAMRWLAAWYPREYSRPLQIRNLEPESMPRVARRSASLLSGGIDSLALIRRNHLSCRQGDEGRVDVGVLVNWNAGSEESALLQRQTYFDRLASRLAAADLGVDVVQVRSNLMQLLGFPRGPWWGRAWHGACFAGVAHAMGQGACSVRIGSSYRLEDLQPWGSHPLIDNELSSVAVSFIHDGLALSRSEKTKIVAGWPEAANVASVCIGDYRRRLEHWNCGECEKCIRTGASFTAAGYPEFARSLTGRDIGPRDVARLRLSADVTASFWEDIAVTAAESGLPELAEAANGIVTSYRRRRMAHRLAGPFGIRKLRAIIRSNLG